MTGSEYRKLIDEKMKIEEDEERAKKNRDRPESSPMTRILWNVPVVSVGSTLIA